MNQAGKFSTIRHEHLGIADPPLPFCWEDFILVEYLTGEFLFNVVKVFFSIFV